MFDAVRNRSRVVGTFGVNVPYAVETGAIIGALARNLSQKKHSDNDYDQTLA